MIILMFPSAWAKDVDEYIEKGQALHAKVPLPSGHPRTNRLRLLKHPC